MTKDEALKLAKVCIQASLEYKRGNATAVEAVEDIDAMLAQPAPVQPVKPSLWEQYHAAQPEPVQKPCGWQFYQDGKWHNGMETSNHRANTEAAGIPVRNVYPTPPASQPAQPASVPDVDWLAQVIRSVNGENTLGAGALAEAIVTAMLVSPPTPQRQWVGLTDEEVMAIGKELGLRWLMTQSELDRLVNLVRADERSVEREACADLCYQLVDNSRETRFANAIRARGNT